MTAIKIMNCLGEFHLKKIKEISFSDIISLRDTTAENENWPLQLCPLLFFFFLFGFVVFLKENVHMHQHL